MKIFNYLFIVMLLFMSCVDSNNDNTLKIKIGETQSNVTIKRFDPPKMVMNSKPDSLDVDGDSQYDFTFTKSIIPLKTGYGLITQLNKRLGVQIVLSSINNYPDTLIYLSTLDSQANWSDKKGEKFVLQGYSCPGTSQYCISTGNFINSKIRYMGFRISDRYGWVKLSNEESGVLKIEEYAISE